MSKHEPQGKREKILIVDDEPAVTDSTGRYLELEGFQPVCRYSGKEGLETAKRERPDLIILDLGLPDLNGFRILETLKQDPAFQHIPVIILTAHTQEEEQLQGWQKGAAHYITKPFEMNELVDAILLALAERRREIQKKTYDI